MDQTASALYLFPLLIGIVAGMRAMTAPAAAALGAYLGLIPLAGTPLAFLGSVYAAGILTVLALVEFVTDQLPSTPSRKVPMQFGARLLTGSLSGAALGASAGNLTAGLVAGLIGSVIGTLGGAELRGRLAKAFGSDPPAAFTEDAIAVALSLFIVLSQS